MLLDSKNYSKIHTKRSLETVALNLTSLFSSARQHEERKRMFEICGIKRIFVRGVKHFWKRDGKTDRKIIVTCDRRCQMGGENNQMS